MESQAQQSQQPRSYTQILLKFNIPKRRGAWAPAYVSTEQHLHGVNYNSERALVAEGLPEETNTIGDSRKNDRDRITLDTGNSLRVHSSRPGKFGYQLIKLELYHTYPANYVRVRVHFRHLGVRELSGDRAIWVWVSLELGIKEFRKDLLCYFVAVHLPHSTAKTDHEEYGSKLHHHESYCCYKHHTL